MLPPGRAKLCTILASTGSPLYVNTTGVVTFAVTSGIRASPPRDTMMSGCERTMSGTIASRRSIEPSPHQGRSM